MVWLKIKIFNINIFANAMTVGKECFILKICVPSDSHSFFGADPFILFFGEIPFLKITAFFLR